MALWLMATLLVKHFICDFPLQNQRMLVGKGIYGDLHGIQHSAEHALGTGLALFICGVAPLTSGLLALLDGLVHYHVDWLKTNTNRWLAVGPEDQMFWTLIGLDQLAHGLTYVMIAALALAY